MAPATGVLLIDKPSGLTSRGVDQRVERLLGPGGRRGRGAPRFRVGHAGTLDPLATGLLLVLVGRATRLQPFLSGLDKRYAATVRFGMATDTLDRDGTVTATATPPAAPDGLDGALARLTGDVLQAPPVMSALKRGGRSLHRRARAGEEVAPPPPRPVRIDRLVAEQVRWHAPRPDDDPGHGAPGGALCEVDLDVVCGSGTYVRAIARDLGEALGTVAHLHALRRLRIGPFDVAEAVTLEALEAAGDPAEHLLDLAGALPHLPAFALADALAADVRQGRQPEPGWLDGDPSALAEAADGTVRLLDSSGALVAVARYDAPQGELRTLAVFEAPTATPAVERSAEDDD
jgi:tRNA pseudouridine55 synthase